MSASTHLANVNVWSCIKLIGIKVQRRFSSQNTVFEGGKSEFACVLTFEFSCGLSFDCSLGMTLVNARGGGGERGVSDSEVLLEWKKADDTSKVRFMTFTQKENKNHPFALFLHLKTNDDCPGRLEICRDRHDRRSCKFFSTCVNFSRKQRVSLQNLRRNMKFTHFFGMFTHTFSPNYWNYTFSFQFQQKKD